MTAIEMNSELFLQLSQIAGNESYIERTLNFLRALTREANTTAPTRGLAYQTLLKRLSDFQEYEQGWDGDNARPIHRNVVKNFKQVLEHCSDSLLTGWTIFPAANGSLLMEYKPREAGINIGKDDFSYYSLHNGQIKGENGQPFTATAVIDTMRQLSND